MDKPRCVETLTFPLAYIYSILLDAFTMDPRP
jgi:hypothetical protein